MGHGQVNEEERMRRELLLREGTCLTSPWLRHAAEAVPKARSFRALPTSLRKRRQGEQAGRRAGLGSLLLFETSLCCSGGGGKKNWPKVMIMEVASILAAPLLSQAVQTNGPGLPGTHNKIIPPPPCNLT